MAWRGVHLTAPACLSYSQGALKIERDKHDPITVPMEDLGWLIIDTPRATLTSRLLSACAEADVLVLVSDERHLPVGALIPRSGYHRQLATIKAQTMVPEGMRKRLWRALVKAKLSNQSVTLRVSHPSDPIVRKSAKAIAAMAGRVKPGDPENIEAVAAQSYWPKLFPGLTRGAETDGRNARLNYAYAIMRAILARELAARGFELSLGLHHLNELNPQNLADDLIEPFRPLCDSLVFDLLAAEHPNLASAEAARLDAPGLSVETRRALANLPAYQVLLGDEAISLLTAASRVVAGLRAALINGKPDLLELPTQLLAGFSPKLFPPAGEHDRDS